MTENELSSAFAHCRAIARREAKNFYYAFRILPPAKSDAMCAIYAFMRRADDIADDESFSVAERRRQMAAWREAWRDQANAEPVFVAVRETQRRFSISDALLDDLVRGTTMDLEQDARPDALATFADFDELYRYCYLVASVVGLVTIRIFGYSDPRAEKLAEETGIAFQLTNILRDIQEDADRGRVYLPLDRLALFGLTAEQIAAAARSGHESAQPVPVKAIRTLLHSLVADAELYYRAADELIPLIDPDSRAALWVLVEIYSRLLDKVSAQSMSSRLPLFSRRARLSTPAKLIILMRGAIQSLTNRLP